MKIKLFHRAINSLCDLKSSAKLLHADIAAHTNRLCLLVCFRKIACCTTRVCCCWECMWT